MKKYTVKFHNSDSTEVSADWFDIAGDYIRFFRQVKEEGRESDLIAIFANVTAVTEVAKTA
jgi:hypothetical protein